VILGDSGEGVRGFRGYLSFGDIRKAGTIVIVDCCDNASESGEGNSRDVSESGESDSGINIDGPVAFSFPGGTGSARRSRLDELFGFTCSRFSIA